MSYPLAWRGSSQNGAPAGSEIGVVTRVKLSQFPQFHQPDATRPVPREKINRFAIAPNQHYNSRHPVPLQGAYRDRHGRWDGMRWTRQRRRANADRRAGFGL